MVKELLQKTGKKKTFQINLFYNIQKIKPKLKKKVILEYFKQNKQIK